MNAALNLRVPLAMELVNTFLFRLSFYRAYNFTHFFFFPYFIRTKASLSGHVACLRNASLRKTISEKNFLTFHNEFAVIPFGTASMTE